MSVVVLPKVDPYIENEQEFAHIDILWLANLVDSINSAFRLMQGGQIDVGGSGAGPIDVAVSGLTATSTVVASIVSSTNPVVVATVVPGVDKFSITFDADPGASAIISYVAFIAQ